MQRYFINNQNIHDGYITVTNKNDIHHMRNVMRMQPGTEMTCVDEDGQAYSCTISDVTAEEIRAFIDERFEENSELPLEVTIFQGLPKKNKLELLIQKGTELGCSRFEMFQAERSIVKWDKNKTSQKLSRLQRIAQEASEQSGRLKVPIIESTSSLEDILMNKESYDLLLFAYEEEAKRGDYTSIHQALKRIRPGMRIGIFIGPEGGFSEDEVAKFRQYGVDSVRLGRRILRTETASIYALACVSYHFEEMGCY